MYKELVFENNIPTVNLNISWVEMCQLFSFWRRAFFTLNF